MGGGGERDAIGCGNVKAIIKRPVLSSKMVPVGNGRNTAYLRDPVCTRASVLAATGRI